MRKLIPLIMLALVISTTATAAEDCVATDTCMLFTNLEDMMRIVALYQQSNEAMQFTINELIVSGKLVKLDEGTRITVIAKSGILIQVYHYNKILYTMNQAVKCR